MKKYILIEDTKVFISCKRIEQIIKKGTEILSDGYVDEDGGIKGLVTKGKYKGKEVIFNKSELTEI